jgi:hypothetical protein
MIYSENDEIIVRKRMWTRAYLCVTYILIYTYVHMFDVWTSGKDKNRGRGRGRGEK